MKQGEYLLPGLLNALGLYPYFRTYVEFLQEENAVQLGRGE